MALGQLCEVEVGVWNMKSGTNFNAQNKCLTVNVSSRAFGIINIEIYRRHHKLVSKFVVGLKPLLFQDLSVPESYGDLTYVVLMSPQRIQAFYGLYRSTMAG